MEDVTAGYGRKQVLYGVSIEVSVGEVVALIGHNGAGKSTVLKVVYGMLPMWSGAITLSGARMDRPNPAELLRARVSYVPQGGRVFSELTVAENLEMGGVLLPDDDSFVERLEHVLFLWPALRSRLRQRAATLSGGEKQMLSLARALIPNPRLLLLDEPSLGLAPTLAREVLQQIQQIGRDSGVTVVVVEQKVRQVLDIAGRVYVLKNGKVSFAGSADELRDDVRLREVYL